MVIPQAKAGLWQSCGHPVEFSPFSGYDGVRTCLNARVMKLANILDSKSSAARLAGSSPASGTTFPYFLYYFFIKISFRLWLNEMMKKTKNLAYIIGVALGDGNLSNPNGRAIRLRISCDTRYPFIIESIKEALKMEMSLPASSYATMAVREVLKCGTSSAYHTTLNVT